MPKKTYVWNPDTRKMELVFDSEQVEHHHFVRGDIQEFKSPITGEIIQSRSDLRRHMKTHGVIQTAELDQKEMARKSQDRRLMAAGIHPKQKAARIDALRGAYEQVRNNNRSKARFG